MKYVVKGDPELIKELADILVKNGFTMDTAEWYQYTDPNRALFITETKLSYETTNRLVDIIDHYDVKQHWAILRNLKPDFDHIIEECKLRYMQGDVVKSVNTGTVKRITNDNFTVNEGNRIVAECFAGWVTVWKGGRFGDVVGRYIPEHKEEAELKTVPLQEVIDEPEFGTATTHFTQIVNAATAVQPRPSGRGEAIVQMVNRDLQDRAETGREKYGEDLKVFNGRDAMWDAYQEVLDLAMYLRQQIEEDRISKLKEAV